MQAKLKTPIFQVRLEPDVAKVVKKSSEDNSRSLPKEVNVLLRKQLGITKPICTS